MREASESGRLDDLSFMRLKAPVQPAWMRGCCRGVRHCENGLAECAAGASQERLRSLGTDIEACGDVRHCESVHVFPLEHVAVMLRQRIDRRLHQPLEIRAPRLDFRL